MNDKEEPYLEDDLKATFGVSKEPSMVARYYRPEHKNTVDDAIIWISQMLDVDDKALALHWFKMWMVAGGSPLQSLVAYCPPDVEQYNVWINSDDFMKLYQRIKKAMPDRDELC